MEQTRGTKRQLEQASTTDDGSKERLLHGCRSEVSNEQSDLERMQCLAFSVGEYLPWPVRIRLLACGKCFLAGAGDSLRMSSWARTYFTAARRGQEFAPLLCAARELLAFAKSATRLESGIMPSDGRRYTQGRLDHAIAAMLMTASVEAIHIKDMLPLVPKMRELMSTAVVHGCEYSDMESRTLYFNLLQERHVEETFEVTMRLPVQQLSLQMVVGSRSSKVFSMGERSSSVLRVTCVHRGGEPETLLEQFDSTQFSACGVRVSEHAVGKLAAVLFQDSQQQVGTLYFLWRVLGAPTAVWPSASTKYKSVMDQYFAPGPGAYVLTSLGRRLLRTTEADLMATQKRFQEHNAQPAFLRLGGIFEEAAGKLAHKSNLSFRKEGAFDTSSCLNSAARSFLGMPSGA